MSFRFRPWDSRRRFVCRLPAGGGGGGFRRRWIALHSTPPDWLALFTRALGLMLIEARPDGHGLSVGSRAGRVDWHGGERWTIFNVDLSGFSARKRLLVARAMAKTARYQSM